jgi:beta-lactamase class A
MRDYSVNFGMGQDIESKTRPFPIKFIFVLFITILVSGIIGFTRFISPKFQPQVKSIAITPTTKPVISIEIAKSMTDLEDKLSAQLDTLPGTYAVYVVDINNNKTIGIHEQTIFMAASVNKIPILAALYYLAGKGEVDLNKQITLQARDVQDYGSGTMRYDPIGTPYSVRTIARLMMEKSDNTAAFILANYTVGLDKIQTLMDNWELTQTNMTTNETSAKDMATLLIKMYKGQITTPALTTEMLDFMKKSDYDDRIPKELPDTVTIYHKTGDEIGKWHDVGIVDLPNRPYFIGILTMDNTQEEDTKQKIADISKMVYDFMK